MGFARSWLAVRGKPPVAVLEELGLRATGARGGLGSAAIHGGPAAAGWYLVVAEGAEHRFLAPAVARRLSAGCELLTCTVEEHVMFSQAASWRDGHQEWTVTHRGEQGPVGLEVAGEPPSEFPAVRERLEAQQEAEGGAEADVDYLFEIPVVLVQQSIGFKHDEPSAGMNEDELEVLEDEFAAPRARSWVDRLLRR